MVPAAGVEPATFRSGGERSNPLSYAGTFCREAKDSIEKCEKRNAECAPGSADFELRNSSGRIWELQGQNDEPRELALPSKVQKARCGTALPPDVRRGFASPEGCDWLIGLCPRSRAWPQMIEPLGRSPHQGHSPSR